MHDSVRAFIAREAPALKGPTLEVGSYDVNGSIRDLLPTPNFGIDIVAGPGVDEVYNGRRLPWRRDGRPEETYWGSVVSTEMFEHVEDPIHMASEMVRVCQPNGIILITARGNGFGHHNPPDRWRFMPGTLAEIFDRLGCRCMEWPDEQVPGIFLRAITSTYAHDQRNPR